MGRMMIRVERQPGQHRVSVEEYKRPKFQVTLDAPEDGGQAGRQGRRLTGKATAYTGAAVGRGQGPLARGPRGPLSRLVGLVLLVAACPQSAAQEIAHGTAEDRRPTARFNVEFVAKPDLSVAEKDEPIFHFTVYADVTDTTGETRSAQRTVQRRLHGPAAPRCPPRVADRPEAGRDHASRRTTLDGEGQKAEGAAEGLSPQAAGEGRAARHLGRRPVYQPQRRRGVARAAASGRSRSRPSRSPICRIPTPGNWARSSPSRV